MAINVKDDLIKGVSGEGLSPWDPTSEPDKIKSGVNVSPGTFILLNDYAGVIDDLINPTAKSVIFFNTILNRWQTIIAGSDSKNRGYYPDQASLPLASDGDFAYVASTNTFWFYYAAWTDTGSESAPDVLKISDIADNLTTNNSSLVLSAKQGYNLNSSKENISNKVTSVSSSSTDTQYPSAKLLYDQLSLKVNNSIVGASNGLATLDSSGKIPSAQIPTSVTDVFEYTSLSFFPATGTAGKIYVALDTNRSYRWSGSAYVLIASDLQLGTTSTTAYRGDRGDAAYTHSQITSGNPHGTTKTDIGLGDVDNTTDLNKPVSTATQTALNLKADQSTTYTKTQVDAISSTIDTTLATKIDKVAGVVNKIPIFDGTGNLISSTKSVADFEPADATIIKESEVINSVTSTATNLPAAAAAVKTVKDLIDTQTSRINAISPGLVVLIDPVDGNDSSGAIGLDKPFASLAGALAYNGGTGGSSLPTSTTILFAPGSHTIGNVTITQQNFQLQPYLAAGVFNGAKVVLTGNITWQTTRGSAYGISINGSVTLNNCLSGFKFTVVDISAGLNVTGTFTGFVEIFDCVMPLNFARTNSDTTSYCSVRNGDHVSVVMNSYIACSFNNPRLIGFTHSYGNLEIIGANTILSSTSTATKAQAGGLSVIGSSFSNKAGGYYTFSKTGDCDYYWETNLTNVLPVNMMGTRTQFPRNNPNATTAPTTSNNLNQGYAVGSTWIYNGITYTLVSFSGTNATWVSSGNYVAFANKVDFEGSSGLDLPTGNATLANKYAQIADATGMVSSGTNTGGASLLSNGSAVYLINSTGTGYSFVSNVPAAVNTADVSSAISSSTSRGFVGFSNTTGKQITELTTSEVSTKLGIQNKQDKIYDYAGIASSITSTNITLTDVNGIVTIKNATTESGKKLYDTNSNVLYVASGGAWVAQSASILDGSITTAKLADSQITTAKIADGQVTSSKLASDVILPSIGDFKTSAQTADHNKWLLCNGAAKSRSTYTSLFSLLCPSLGSATITIASPAVVTLSNHGLIAGDKISFETTGALPTGLSVGVNYYVLSNGLAANTFQVSTSEGGTAVTTSGTQTGVHSVRKTPFGCGNGSTTFTLPDPRGRALAAMGAGSGLTNRPLGQSVGAETHTLSTNEMPSHSHDFKVGGGFGNSSYSYGGDSGYSWNSGGYTERTYNAGGGVAHNNMQPSIFLGNVFIYAGV